MTSIRELRNDRRRQSFTGRKVELNTFRQLLLSDAPEYAIYQVYGVGGVGKSTLLDQFRRIAQQLGYPVARVDLQVNFGVIEILRTLRSQFEGRYFGSFDKSLSTYNQVEGRLQNTATSLSDGLLSGVREGVPFGLGALAVDTVGEERIKNWLYQHLPHSNAELYLHADHILTTFLIDGLNAMVEKSGKAVLLLDTYELSSRSQDAWLRDVMLESELSSDVLLVIAGRDRLSDLWHEWYSVLLSLELSPFTVAEAREYLKKRGISSPSLVEALLTVTGRFPWSLALITDTSAVRKMSVSDLERTAAIHNLGDLLVDRFLSQVSDDSELKDLVYLCAIPRNFDFDVIRELWNRADVTGALDRIRRFSFVRVRDDGRWSIHGVVRQAINQRLKTHSPQRWKELNRTAAVFYKQRSEDWPLYSDEWRWLTLENLYHEVQVREDEGIRHFANLFEAAKRFSHYDFCSELLSTLDELELQTASCNRWVEYYRGKMARLVNSTAWRIAHQVNQKLYALTDIEPALKARVANDLGRYYFHFSCQYIEAVAALEEAFELRRQEEGDYGEALVLSHLAPAYAAAGLVNKAREAGQRCVSLSQKLGDAYREGWGHYSLGESEIRVEHWENALASLERAAHLFETLDSEFELGVVLRRVGRAQLMLERWEPALANFRANLALMRKYDKRAWAVRALVDICELHHLRGDSDAMEVVTREAHELLLRQSNPAQAARLLLLEAEKSFYENALDDAVCLYADSLIALAQTPGCVNDQVAARHLERIGKVQKSGQCVALHTLINGVQGDIERALDGHLERNGNLVSLDEPTCARLREICVQLSTISLV